MDITVLYLILGALAVLILVLLVNTWVKTAKAKELTGEHPVCSEEDLEKYALGLQAAENRRQSEQMQSQPEQIRELTAKIDELLARIVCTTP